MPIDRRIALMLGLDPEHDPRLETPESPMGPGAEPLPDPEPVVPPAPAPPPAPTPVEAIPELAQKPQQVDMQTILAKLGEARKEGDRRRMTASLFDAGTTLNAALAGTKADRHASESFMQQAGIPEAQAKEDITMGLNANKGESGDFWKALAVVDRRRALGNKEENDKTKAGVAEEKLKQGARGLDQKDRGLGQGDTRNIETNRHNLVTEAKPTRGGTGSSVDNRYINTSVQKLGEKTSKAFSQFAEAFSKVEERAPGLIGGKVPEGFEVSASDRYALNMPGGLGTRFISPKTQDLLTAVKNVRDLLSRDRSGAVLNDHEVEHYRSLIGDQVASDPQAMANGLRQIRDGIAQKLRDLQLPYGEAAVPGLESLSAFERGGGTSYHQPIWGLKDSAGKPYAWPPSAQPPADLAPAAPPLNTNTPLREPAAPETKVIGNKTYERDPVDGNWYEVE